MSLAVLKRKTNAKRRSLPNVPRNNKAVDNKNFCGECDHTYISDGSIFSINGKYRDITPVKKDYKMSAGGTKYKTVYDKHRRYVVPTGNGGTNGRYPRVISFNLERCCADNTNTVKPSTLDNSYLMDKDNRNNHIYKKFPVKDKDGKVVSYKNKWIVSNDNKDYNGGYNKRLKDKEVKLVTYTDKLEMDSKVTDYQFGNASFHNKKWFNTFSHGYNDAYLKTYKDEQVLLGKNKDCKQDCKINN